MAPRVYPLHKFTVIYSKNLTYNNCQVFSNVNKTIVKMDELKIEDLDLYEILSVEPSCSIADVS